MSRGKKSEAILLAEMEDRRQLRSELFKLVGHPSVIRLGALAATLIGTRVLRDTWGRDNIGARDISAGIGALGCALIAADAGITDRWALAAIAAAGGVAVGQGEKGGVLALGRGAWDSGALVQIDPFQVSSIWSGLSD